MKALILMLLLAMPAFAQQRTLVATATDITMVAGDLECGVDYVQFYLDGTAVGPRIATPLTGNQYSYVLDTATIPNGTYALTARAADKAGPDGLCDSSTPNIGVSAPLQFVISHVIPDTTPPTITLQQPLIGAIVTTKTQAVQVAANDSSPITKIVLKINGVVKATVTNAGALNFLWNTSPYKGQTVKLEATATDASGNTGTIASSVRVIK